MCLSVHVLSPPHSFIGSAHLLSFPDLFLYLLSFYPQAADPFLSWTRKPWGYSLSPFLLPSQIPVISNRFSKILASSSRLSWFLVEENDVNHQKASFQTRHSPSAFSKRAIGKESNWFDRRFSWELQVLLSLKQKLAQNLSQKIDYLSLRVLEKSKNRKIFKILQNQTRKHRKESSPESKSRQS